MKRFDLEFLRAGDIVHARSNTFLGACIRRAVGSWGNHDAIVCVDANGVLRIGDAEPPRANLAQLHQYEEALAAGVLTGVRVYRPAAMLGDALDGVKAARWWTVRVQGRPYDFHAIGRLLIKSIVGDRFPWPCGWNWAWYCTEGVRDAWRIGAGRDLYLKNNPTPRTTELRVDAGWLEDVTDLALVDDAVPDGFPAHPVFAQMGGAHATACG